MRHDPKSGIFNGAYLNEKVRFDVQSAFLERPSTDGLTRAFTHMGLTCDPRAPKDVPQEVMNALPPTLNLRRSGRSSIRRSKGSTSSSTKQEGLR